MRALRGVSCRIARGRFAFIVGPSGSGKSTLLYLLGALDRPTAGSIKVEGKDLTAMSEAEQNAYRRDKVGFIFQSFNLISNLTAVENVLVPFMPRGVPAGMKEKAETLLGEVGLSDRIDHRPYQMSGGEQQRGGDRAGTYQKSDRCAWRRADRRTRQQDGRRDLPNSFAVCSNRGKRHSSWSPMIVGLSRPTIWYWRFKTANFGKTSPPIRQPAKRPCRSRGWLPASARPRGPPRRENAVDDRPH